MRSLIIGLLIMLPVLTVIFGISITDDVSFGELIAISVTIAGGVIAAGVTFYNRKRERRRKAKLINFPIGDWKAYRRKEQGKLELQIFANVYMPYNSFSCKVITEVEGKVIDMDYKVNTSPFKRERCLITGLTDLNAVLLQSESITTSMVIELDGEFKKSSEKTTISIVDT